MAVDKNTMKPCQFLALVAYGALTVLANADPEEVVNVPTLTKVSAIEELRKSAFCSDCGSNSLQLFAS